MKKQSKGITLIALVITIIILLILAGISIASILGSGLFEKANQAKSKSNEAELRENVNFLLLEYQVEKVNNTDLKLFDFFKQKKDEKIIDDVKEKENGKIEIGLKGYTITIDIKQMVIVNIEKGSNIKFSFELISSENNKYKIKIKVTDIVDGIDSIKYPDQDIQIEKKYDGQKEIEIEYELEEGKQYKFIIKNMKGTEKEEVISLSRPKQPEFKTTETGYPTFTSTGIEEPKVEIVYDENTEFKNYYSIDNGVTWILYTEPINIIPSTIKAKSVHKDCKDIYSISEKILNVPGDALLYPAYDNDLNSYVDYIGGSEQYDKAWFYVDKSVWGDSLEVTYQMRVWGDGEILTMSFWDVNGEMISKEDFTNKAQGIIANSTSIIPEATYKVCLHSSYYSRQMWIYNVRLYNN